MTEKRPKRDYSLIGPEAERAAERGLLAAEWYHTDVAREDIRALMVRSDAPAIRDTIIWLGAMVVFAGLGIYFWGSWLAVPFFLAYGVLYGSASDSRWHECSHGTAFKTRWMNKVVYQIASFMIMRNPSRWRWSHARHHADTIIVGADPEIVLMRPPAVSRVLINLFGVLDAYDAMKQMVLNAFGIIDEQDAVIVPETEQAKMIFVARIWLVIYLVTIAAAIWMGSILPLMLIGLPRLYGAWHHVICGVMQHAGLAEDVLDHRLNSRTVYLNPISRFIYWNMNYHVEHHMFPIVPYHALPKLHALIKHDLPAPCANTFEAYREIIPAALRQMRYENWFVKRSLPDTAKPYRAEFHADVEPSMEAAE